MTYRIMSRLPLLLIALVASSTASSSLFAPRARAQTAFRNVTEVRIDGKKKELATPVFINSDECDEQFVFKLTNVAATVPVMEAWVSTGTDCRPAANRSTTTTTTPDCWLAGDETGVSGEYEFTLPGPAIFNRQDPTQCPAEAIEQRYVIHFVPLRSSSSLSGTTAPPPIETALQASVEFTLFTQRPSPPEDVRAYGGENELRVTWERVDTNPRTRYQVFFDYGTGGPAECGSVALEQSSGGGPVEDAMVDDIESPDAAVGDPTDAAIVNGTDVNADSMDASSTADVGGDVSAGQALPPAAGTPFVKVLTGVRGESASLRDLADVPLGRQVRVAVSRVDPTGNVGYLSERHCVTRVETTSFIDACQASAECELDSCSASSGRTGSAVGLSLFALALTALIRRRRSA